MSTSFSQRVESVWGRLLPRYVRAPGLSGVPSWDVVKDWSTPARAPLPAHSTRKIAKHFESRRGGAEAVIVEICGTTSSSHRKDRVRCHGKTIGSGNLPTLRRSRGLLALRTIPTASRDVS
jgi:hypothetical protein